MPFPKKWENLPAETTPISAEALQNLEERTTNGVNATNFTGVDPTGATDSTAGLETAIKEARTKNVALYVPGGKYKIGTGGTGLDFRKCFAEAVRYDGFEMICASGAIFEGAATLTSPVLIIGSPKEAKFVNFYLKFGKVKSNNKASRCVEVVGIFNSYLFFGTVEGLKEAPGYGILLNPTTEPTQTSSIIGNNEFHITNMLELGNGIVSFGNEAGNAVQCSGNLFLISEIINCTESGIALDGIGHNTEWNSFYVGDIEHCTKGVFDGNGNNRFNIGSMNSNSTCSYELAEGAVAASSQKVTGYVRLASSDTTSFILHEQPIDACNTFNGELGWVPLASVNGKISLGKGIGGSKNARFAICDGQVRVSLCGEAITEMTAGATLATIPEVATFARPPKNRIMPMYQTLPAVVEPGQGVQVSSTGLVQTKVKLPEKAVFSVEASYPLKVSGE